MHLQVIYDFHRQHVARSRFLDESEQRARTDIMLLLSVLTAGSKVKMLIDKHATTQNAIKG